MPESVISRRTFLAAAGLGTAALVAGCDIATVPGTSLTPVHNPPKTSPFLPGPFQIDQVILGEDASGVSQPLSKSEFPGAPSSIHAVVYYPAAVGNGTPAPSTNLLGNLPIAKGPFPLLLYAHACRLDNTQVEEPDSPPFNRDFTSVAFMLRHVASYGCVCLAPDMSWLGEGFPQPTDWDFRARILLACYKSLASVYNFVLFRNQIDLSRVVLVGHSCGGGGAVHAGRLLATAHQVQPKAFGLIAPLGGGDTGPDIGNLVVLGGTLDTQQHAEPVVAYELAGQPKTQIIIGGANHFGYTDICQLDNKCDFADIDDTNGSISRAGQQQTGAAYLAAMVRFYALGDATARPYLTPEERVEGLEVFGVTDINVQSQGIFITPATPTPSRPTPAGNI